MGARSGKLDARNSGSDPPGNGPDGAGTKKLTVAFHFQFSEPAAWKCDSCRRQRLDISRRCAFLPAETLGPAKPVWVRGRVSAEQCPKSIVTAESLRLLELFAAWKVTPHAEVQNWPARDVDGLLVLEQEWRSLENHGESK